MRRYEVFLTLFFVAVVGLYLGAREKDLSLLTLERIFSSKEFTAERFGPARWMKDGSGYTTLESSEAQEGGQDIVRHDPDSGRREIIIPCTRLIPKGESSPLQIDSYEWSPDGKRLLIFTNSKRIWRQ